ncbi:hypothetical protein BDP27DRAFT_1414577 [Rhodocollybia butyracea]|uniref:Uncharacterized protein n=1 Tax=Rhodocollybia butyracea TaxID=206335 RepID=A0A9P5Q5X4_9AGAR|nr:hypothetical protein BDP27DRAFT_1414577 [Rhodocollybia butyracea]
MQPESSEEAEAGPSNLNSTHHHRGSSHTRLHFPNSVESSQLQPQRNLGYGHKPNSKSITDTRGLALKEGSNSRRRVLSVDAGNVNANRKRVPTVSMGASTQRVASLHSTDSKDSDSPAGWGLGTLSDEYDLDPRILQEVQRALKLKYRREVRAMSGQLNHPSPPTSPPKSPRSFPITVNSSSPESTARSKASPGVSATAPSADIDFGPSVGPAKLRVDLHPVPFSVDNGHTLDWSGHFSDEEKSERKWTLNVSKSRKGKEKEILSADDLKRQEGLHAAKLNRIKTISSQLTLKKVAITSDQLGRRYNLISSGSDRFNLLKVSRWYGEQEFLIRSALEKAEPFPWLRHLHRQTRRQAPDSDTGTGLVEGSVRMPWHLSALIMQEYVHALNARNRHHAMRSIPEHPSDFVHDSEPDSSSFPSMFGPPLVPETSPTFSHSPTRGPPSSRFSQHSFSTSLSKHISDSGRVSFEPLLESRSQSPFLEPPPPIRPSNESRRSLESTFSSLFSTGDKERESKQNLRDRPAVLGAASPASSKSRLHLKEGLVRRRRGNESDEGSSAAQSDADKDKGEKPSKRSSWLGRNHSQEPFTSPRSTTSVGVVSPIKGGNDLYIHVDGSDLNTAKPGVEPDPTPIPAASSNDAQNTTQTRRVIINRSLRLNSLPSEARNALVLERKRRQEADEARADLEYDLKSQLLAQCKDSNTRIRSVLNHIAQHVREYEMCQSSFVSNTLANINSPRSPDPEYTGYLPQDLLEAFSHDPANVTSSTKRLKTYRAVDDIYNRLMRQRAVFREFLESNASGFSGRGDGRDGFPVTKDILKDPIDSLMRSLRGLEENRLAIVNKEKEVSEVLKKTQVIHAGVKAEYNTTLAHTSVVYPELSQIVGLEESYKDQYQHLWDIGMDALTFILDTVTPFWRTYGKTIGDDVQVFLIIPLYRNEFTGEAKRYPITRLPQRSFRHWVGLLALFLLTVMVMILQARAALACSVNYKLQWIPYGGVRWAALPLFWMGILIQWMAVSGELAVLVMQVGTVLWWIGWWVRILD